MAPTEPTSLPAPCHVLHGNRPSLVQRHRWLVFVLPMAVYSLAGCIEPAPHSESPAWLGLSPALAYSVVYTFKIAATLAAMAFVLPGYRQFRRPPCLLAVLIGAVGVVVWIGLWDVSQWIGLTARLPGLGGSRPEFNPLQELAVYPGWAWTFFAIRFFGLAAVVPVIEEFFLRGFLMRLVVDQEWWNVPFGKLTWAVVAVSIAWPVTHAPSEYLAAEVWFGMVTWLMIRTRNPWDCVTAHAVTNLLLGIYVVTRAEWALW